MFSFKHGVAVAVFAAASLAGGAARAEVEIQFWHSMTGPLADRVNGLAAQKIVGVGVAAFDGQQHVECSLPSR